MKFRVINNATTLVDEDFIIDPWIYGNLYNNTWSPKTKPTFKKKDLKKIKHCFISHVHQDHWDLDTIKYFNKKVKFYLPDLPFNYIIGKTLQKFNFKNIIYLPLSKFHKISNKYKIFILGPLNSYGLETDSIDVKDDDNVAIDTGVILNSIETKTNHLLLSDNSPYDLKIYKKYLDGYKNLKISSIFFPYNGFAQDFPLNYENYSLSEKKKISQSMSSLRERYLIRFINYIKPKILIPYSSDFKINHLKKLFKKVHPKIFLDKELYSKRIEKKTKIKSTALYDRDLLLYSNNQFKVIKYKGKLNLLNKDRVKINLPRINKNLNFKQLLQKSFQKYFERISKYNMNIADIKKSNLTLEIDKKKYFLNTKDRSISIIRKVKKNKSLVLITNRKIMQAILEKKIHINNAQIGCLLNWRRYPKSYLSTVNIFKSLNFLHV